MALQEECAALRAKCADLEQRCDTQTAMKRLETQLEASLAQGRSKEDAQDASHAAGSQPEPSPAVENPSDPVRQPIAEQDIPNRPPDHQTDTATNQVVGGNQHEGRRES